MTARNQDHRGFEEVFKAVSVNTVSGRLLTKSTRDLLQLGNSRSLELSSNAETSALPCAQKRERTAGNVIFEGAALGGGVAHLAAEALLNALRIIAHAAASRFPIPTTACFVDL
jgi:hypothetical protein